MIQATSVFEEIEAAHRAFERAFERRDMGALADLYSADPRAFPSHHEVLAGTPTITAFWRAVTARGVTSCSIRATEVASSGDTAYDVGRYTMLCDDGVVDRGTFLNVWKRERGRWKLHREFWNSSLPEDRADPGAPHRSAPTHEATGR
ncbi:MAG: nuclear transport factor 2 family protein [Deinococcales bacterium]|jgi:ketosteroid isomerase-like protein